MKIAVLCGGSRVWASSRIRGYWLQDRAPDIFSAVAPGEALPDIDQLDAVVFQKRHSEADRERARRYRDRGVITIYDLTDPLYWWYPADVDAMVDAVDVVTASSYNLTAALQERYPNKTVVPVLDRMLATAHPHTVTHGPRDMVRLVWFGDARNRLGLYAVMPLLESLAHEYAITLTVIDNAPEEQIETVRLPVEFVPWALETFNANLLDCDIAVLPAYPGEWGKLKSNNRAQTARWLGLPVWNGERVDHLRDLIEHADQRERIGAAGRELAEQHDETQRMVEELVAVVTHLRRARQEASHAAV